MAKIAIFPDFSLTGKSFPKFPGFPDRVGTLNSVMTKDGENKMKRKGSEAGITLGDVRIFTCPWLCSGCGGARRSRLLRDTAGELTGEMKSESERRTTWRQHQLWSPKHAETSFTRAAFSLPVSVLPCWHGDAQHPVCLVLAAPPAVHGFSLRRNGTIFLHVRDELTTASHEAET